MSDLDTLLRELASQGVRREAFGDIGTIIRGRRFVRNDLRDSGIPCIHYGEVYTSYGISATKTVSYLDPDLAAKLRVAHPGDVVIVSAGETVEDIGKAVAWLGEEDVVIHDACYAFRSNLDPKYVSYFLRTDDFHAQVRRYITSSKISAISPQHLAKVLIPMPPIEVQREIVRILDHLTELQTELEAALEAELSARRLQYEFYCNELLTFTEAEVPRAPLGELASIGTGSRNTNESVEGGRYPFFVRSQDVLAIDEYEYDEPAVITAGDGVGVGKVFHYVDGKYGLHQRAYRIKVTTSDLLPKFLFHYIRSDFARYLATKSFHASVTSLRKPMFESYLVPVPPLAEQERIVSILDTFEALVSALAFDLSAELEARREQLKFYREALLTFPEVAA